MIEFLSSEVDAGIRSQLLAAIADLHTGQQRYFTYNAFNVLLDADADAASVEDELDAACVSCVTLEEFAESLCDEAQRT